MFNWETLEKIGRNRNLGSMTFALIFCPILAKFLNQLNSIERLDLDLNLPWTFLCLYVGGVTLVIGTGVHAFFCPELIKRFKKHSDFLNESRGAPYLRRTLYEGAKLPFSKPLDEALDELKDHADLPGEQQNSDLSDIVGEIWDISNIKKELKSNEFPSPRTFYFCRELLLKARPAIRKLITVMLAISGVMFASVAVINAVAVCRNVYPMLKGLLS